MPEPKTANKCRACREETKRISDGKHLGSRPRLSAAEAATLLGVRYAPSAKRKFNAARLGIAREAHAKGACTWHCARALRVPWSQGGLVVSCTTPKQDPQTPFMGYKPGKHSARARRLVLLTSIICQECSAGVGEPCVSASKRKLTSNHFHKSRKALLPNQPPTKKEMRRGNH